MPRFSSLALLTADPFESAMPALRVTAPARAAGVAVIRGNHGEDIHFEAVDAADMVVIQRDFPRFEGCDTVLDRAARLGKPVVYEVDDQILELPPEHVSRAAFEGVGLGILRAALRANAVVASTPPLQDYFRAFNPHTLLVQNALPDDLWPLREPASAEAGQLISIGYMGGATHRADLEAAAPALLAVLNRYGERVRACFWGGEPPESLRSHPRVSWEALDMRDYAAFAHYFSSQYANIFIAPLSGGEFNRYKSPIKFLEYSSLGAPGVCARAEPYAAAVREGENGLLASTPAEWEAALSRLVDDAGLRRKLAQGAQDSLRKGWLLSKRLPEWVAAYEAALDAPAPEASALERVLAGAAAHQRRLESRTREAETRAGGLQDALNEQSAHMAGLQARLDALTGSRSYRLLRSLQSLYDRLRRRA